MTPLPVVTLVQQIPGSNTRYFTCWVSEVAFLIWCRRSAAASGFWVSFFWSFRPPHMSTFVRGFSFNLLRCFPDFLISLFLLVMQRTVLFLSPNLSPNSLFIFLAKSWWMWWRLDSDQQTVTCSTAGSLVKSFFRGNVWCILLYPRMDLCLSDFFATIHKNRIIVTEFFLQSPTLESFMKH